MKRPISTFSLVNAVLLILFGVIMLYPFIYMIAVSLSEDIYVLRGEVFLWPKGINFKVYEIVLADPRISTAYLNTLLYTTLGTAIALTVTSMGAYALSKERISFYRTFMFLIVFTMFFSGGMIPNFLVVKSMGLLDSIWAMVLPGAISTWYFVVMRSFFQGIPKELEESGKMDGLNDIGIFCRIAIPLSKAALATIGLFYAVGIWNNFYNALLYLRSPSLFPLQVVLRNIVFAGQVINGKVAGVGGDHIVVDESLKYATIIIATVPILLVYPFLQKYFVKGVMIGSIKG